jgi:hypothetical protein
MRPVVVGVNQHSQTLSATDSARVDQVMTTIGKLLLSTRDCALSTIVDELINMEHVHDDDTGERVALTQLAFNCLGWLSTW